MDNFSQKTPSFKPGQALPAGALNHIVEAVKRLIVAGAGIRIERAGDQITIHAKGSPMARGGGAAAEDVFVYGTSFAGLPTVTAVNKFARVTDGAQEGMTCVVNADGNGWVPFTHFG